MDESIKVIVVSGLPCTGKSAIAEGLAATLKQPLLSVDPIESALLRCGFERCFETGLAAYVVAQALGGEQIRLGLSVVVDAVNAEPEGKRMWRDLAATHAAKLVVIECVCSDDSVHKQRVESRIRNLHGIPEVTWEDVVKRRRAWTAWREPHIVVDSIGDIRENLARVIDYVRSV
jgi:predicted kinase